MHTRLESLAEICKWCVVGVGWVRTECEEGEVQNNLLDCEARTGSKLEEQMRGYKCLCYPYADAINIAF